MHQDYITSYYQNMLIMSRDLIRYVYLVLNVRGLFEKFVEFSCYLYYLLFICKFQCISTLTYHNYISQG